MDDLQKLEAELQKRKVKSNLIEIVNTFGLGVKELSKTVSKIFNVPKDGENQISRELQGFEDGIILERKHN